MRTRVVLSVVGAIALGVLAFLLLRSPLPEKTAEGTTVGGLAAGGLDRAALTSALNAAIAASPARSTVVLGTQRVAVTRAELGLVVDVPETVDKALDESGAGRRWYGGGSTKGKAVTPVLVREDPRLQKVVDRLVKAGGVPESHGSLKVGDTLPPTFVAVPPADGQEVEPDVVETALEKAAASLPAQGSITVPVKPVAAHIAPETVTALAATATRLLQEPVVLKAGTKTFTTHAALARQIHLVATGSGPGHPLELGLRPTAAEAIAAPAAKALSVTPAEPTVIAPSPTARLSTKGTASWRPTPATTRLGAPGRTGQAVTEQQVLTELKALLSGAEPGPELALDTQPDPPDVSDAAVSSIDAVLGTFTTEFTCCQPRVRNLQVMTRTVDGTLIGPGKSFSLNGIVGPRTRAKGYVEAPFILDGELSTDVGGGVSQFATTTLNAAWFAGLELDRHQAHSFYISRYPPGREATVNFPGIDLRWTNNTAWPVLVRAATTGTTITITLYGHDDKRVVSSVTGPRRPVPGRDFRITVVRTVQIPGKATTTREFTTTYNRPPEED